MERKPFTSSQAKLLGLTESTLRTGVSKGNVRRIEHGVYLHGSAATTKVEQAHASLLGSGGIAIGTLAATLLDLDGVSLAPPYAATYAHTRRQNVVRRRIDPVRVIEVDGYRCTDGLQTMLDLAAVLDDHRWEQALESALRNGLTSIDVIIDALQVRRVGNKRIRRVLQMRPDKAPPTGSWLETVMVQLIRTEPRLAAPRRQVEVLNSHGNFVAYVDLAWPDHGLFLELDGGQHKKQPIYDARRETAVVAATGWLPGRFTWHEMVNLPASTLRRVVELFERAKEGKQ
jgi:very-short-patch-repair endonuclease